MTHDPADGIRRFFAYARERQTILLRRRAGRPGPWTEDGILQTYRFCNVHREDDTTTIWLRENVRERVAPEDLLLATVLFRWFNRIRTGEAIFVQKEMFRGRPVWDTRENVIGDMGLSGFTDDIRAAVKAYCGAGPYVTGSYIIKTPDGYNKLDGVLWCLEQFMTERHEMSGISGSPLSFRDVSRMLVSGEGCISAEMLWGWLMKFPYLGGFMAYEVVTDLDQTFHFADRMTWANAGPGATRGLGRVYHGDKDRYRQNQRGVLNGLMRELLAAAQDPQHWPQPIPASNAAEMSTDQGTYLQDEWPAWDMRTVEHTLCEWDKYSRVQTGEGRPRQVFRP